MEGFSDNIREILYNFSGGDEKGLAPIYETLARKKLLYLITSEVASENIDLHPGVVSNYEMGLIYEYIIRKFKEGYGDTTFGRMTRNGDSVRVQGRVGCSA